MNALKRGPLALLFRSRHALAPYFRQPVELLSQQHLKGGVRGRQLLRVCESIGCQLELQFGNCCQAQFEPELLHLGELPNELAVNCEGRRVTLRDQSAAALFASAQSLAASVVVFLSASA